MEKKIYEGYKRTSKSVKDTTVETATATKTANPQTQKKSQNTAKPAGKSAISKPRLAMFIDVDNVGVSHENLLEVLFYANGKYKIESCTLYGFSEDTLPGIREIASEYNVVTVGKMKFKQSGVNCLDSRLLIDAYECALNNRNKIDMIFVWCYPCDLSELFEKIINLGINTATIDNSVFDCKNKFVSQTFKLYSPYHFNFEPSMYGKVRNEPSEIAPSTNIEKDVTKSDSVSAQNVNTPTTNKTLSPFDEGYVPPVLPRRTIVERSNPEMPKPIVANDEANQSEVPTQEEETSTEEKPVSLVEEIARKLNIAIPSEEELNEKDANESTDNPNDIIMDLLKQVGFGDKPEEKSLKYEDTIGDL